MPTNATTRLVYRVEHADYNNGPFTEGTWTLHGILANAGLAEPVDYDDEDQEAFHSASNGFPDPMNDPGLRRRWLARYDEPSMFDEGEFVCGCRTPAQLGRWFPPPLADYLDREGYEVTVWEVPRKAVAHGRAQVMFNRDAAECVAQFPVAQLHKSELQLAA